MLIVFYVRGILKIGRNRPHFSANVLTPLLSESLGTSMALVYKGSRIPVALNEYPYLLLVTNGNKIGGTIAESPSE